MVARQTGLIETLAYDAARRPTSISLGGAGSISQAFDRAGNITADGRSLTGISGDAGSGTQAFTYDGLSRLTGSTGLTLNRTYQYDLDGNRTRRVEGAVTTDFTYDRADQVTSQVIAGTTRTYDYDRFGNLLTSADATSATTTYAYDEASRLTTISPPGGAATQVTFTLDALDRHKTRLVNAALTDTYQYLDSTETAWQTGSGTTTSALLDADGTRLAVKTGGSVSWLLFDLHGSVVALCPAGSTTLSDAYRFDGFGQQIASAGTATNPWRYRGLLNIGSDALTGALLDMGARDYSPQLGAFTQVDSVQGSAANPLTMNRFLYALANPATLIDPDGHMAMTCGGGCGAYPEVQIGDATSCARCGDRQLSPASLDPPVSVPRSAAPIDESIGFTGYAPWEIDADAGFNDLFASAAWGCVNVGYSRSANESCVFIDELQAWKNQNKELYCSFHRADCDASDRGGAHVRLGGLGMIPVLGILFNGADAVLYISEGDGIGMAIAIGSSVPIAGPIAKVKWLDSAINVRVGGSLSGSALARSGLAAEDIVAGQIGIARNVGAGRVTVAGSGPGGFRVPDFNPWETIASRGTIVEVKGTAKLSTSSHLRDLVGFARGQGVPLEIFTNAALPRSGELAQWIQRGWVMIRPL